MHNQKHHSPPPRKPQYDQRPYKRPSGESATTDPRQERLQEYIDLMLAAKGEERIRLARQMAREGRPAISAVDRLLNSRDRNLRLIATQVLSSTQHPDALRGLAHAMSDDDAAVRLQASVGLGNHNRLAARQALWQAFPDNNRAVSVAILRSLGKIMTQDMADALRAMDTQHLPPVVKQELDRVLAQHKSSTAARQTTISKPSVKRKASAPLVSAKWLRLLPGDLCSATLVPGTQDIAANVLHWQLPEITLLDNRPNELHFTIPAKVMPQLTRVRICQSIWVAIQKTPNTSLASDTELVATLDAFVRVKGLQSILSMSGGSSSSVNALAKTLGLRSARAPGNPRTLRIRIDTNSVWVEFLAEIDYPALRQISGQARALAASLGALCVAGAQDEFLDPFCHEGLVVIERGLLGPATRLLGCSFDEQQLTTSQQNWRRLAPAGGILPHKASFSVWSQQRLPFSSASINAIASILTPNSLNLITPAHFKEISRVMHPEAKAAFLTPNIQQLRELLAAGNLHIQQELAVGSPIIGHLVLAGKQV